MPDNTEETNGGDSLKSPASHNDFGPNVHISSHPVLSHKITRLRSSTTKPGTFRALIKEITYHLGYEATSDLTTAPVPISVPIGKETHMDWKGSKLVERVALIPILRSGLGMVDSMLELLPNAAIHHIGMYKVKGQNPVLYYNRLPKKCEADVAFILDPTIATSSTILSVVNLLKKVCIKDKELSAHRLESSFLTSVGLFCCTHILAHASFNQRILVGCREDPCNHRDCFS